MNDSFSWNLWQKKQLLEQIKPILLDVLNGACHRAYGSMPNMTWIFTKAGIPIYKSGWTDALYVENAIQYFLEVGVRQQSGERMAGFQFERIDFRTQDREGFRRGLERNGPKAVGEFYAAFDKN